MDNEQSAASPKASILLVDDQPANLLALEAVLGDLGHHLVKATAGEAALRLLAEQDFAVVLLDVRMHGLDGFETARQLRARERSRHTPIIFLTAHEESQAILEEAYALGAVDYLVKPLVPVILRAKVAVFIDLFQKAEQIKRQADQLHHLERRAFERRLAEENARFRALTEYSSDAASLIAADGTVLYNSPSSRRILGYEPEDFVGRSWFEIVHPEDVARAVGHLAELVCRPAASVTLEMRVRHQDGAWRWVEAVGTNLLGEEAIAALVINFRDITERRRATEALQESDERFRQLAENVRVVFWMSDPHKNQILYVSHAYEAVWGRTCQSLYEQPRSFLDAIHPDDRARVQAQSLDPQSRGQPADVEYRVVQPGGAVRWVRDRSFPIRDAAGQAYRIAGIAEDVTDAKGAAEALRASKERFRLLTEVVPQLVWSSRPDGTLDYCNPRWLHYTGLTLAEAQADGWEVVLHPADIHATLAAWEWAAAAGEEYQVEQRLRGRDGQYRWFLTRALPLRDAAGHVVEWYGTCTDIDERKHAEQTTRFLADASATLAALVDYQSTLQQVASLAVPAFADLCAVDMLEDDGALRRLAVADVDPGRAELVRDLLRRCPPDPDRPSGSLRVVRDGQSEVVPEVIDALATGGPANVDHLLPLQAVGVRSYLCVPLRARGRPLGALTFAAAESGRHFGPADLSLAEDLAHRATIAIENARLYRELREADRRKDEFLAMLAHELRNPLAPIRNALHLLRQPDTDSDAAERAGDMVERQVQTMVRLVDDLLDVSRITRGKIQLRTEPVDVGTVLQRAVESARPLLEASRHQFTLTLPAEPVTVDADPTRLEQIFANLLNNAAKYTERGGSIWLEAARQGGEVAVRVRDTGFGIPAHVLPHIFDLFTQADRTLDRSQGGLGIGLTLVKTLAEMHGGAVEAHSAGPGQGSEFVVRLPVSAGAVRPAVESAGPRTTRPRGAGSVSVLVVDDNRDSADSLAILLRTWGHEVRTAYDGLSGVKAACSFRPHVVLLDIGLPGLDGYQVARKLRDDYGADLRLVAMTGYGQDEDRRRSREAGFDRHFVKPLDLAVLRELLAGVPVAVGGERMV